MEKIGAAKGAGTFPTLEKWRTSSFASLLPLCKLPGITPKKIRVLIKELKINSFDALQDSFSNMSSFNSVKLDDESKRIIYEFARSNAGS